jgi:hypothetical protein
MCKEKEKEGVVIMNAYVLKPTMPFVARNQLKRTPPTEENRKMVEFMDSHDFSVSVDKDSKGLRSHVTLKK